MLPPLRYRLETRDGQVVGVDGGRIVDPGGHFETVVCLPEGQIRPGLVNPHDHLHRNHYPRLGSPPYDDAYEWGRDIHARDSETIARGRAVPRSDALLFGALKNLMSGVTTVVHHDPWHPMFARRFPIRVARVRSAHSLGTDPELAEAANGDPDLPLCVHLAEGTSEAMAEEPFELDRRGMLGPQLLAVHGVGIDPAGAQRLAAADAAIIWCPTSNEFLFGRTVSRQVLESGVDVLLGSDSLLTADGTLLDELRAARRLDLVDDHTLVAAVGAVAARRLRLPPPTLSEERPADLAHFRKAVFDASPVDVSLVVVGGMPRYGDVEYDAFFEAAGVATERIDVSGVPKLVASPLGAVARRIVRDWPESGRIFV